MAQRSRNTWNDRGGGGEGRQKDASQVLHKNGFLTDYLLFEAPKFVVTKIGYN